MNICQKERIFFLNYAIRILSLFTYSVCDEKVKIMNSCYNYFISFVQCPTRLKIL